MKKKAMGTVLMSGCKIEGKDIIQVLCILFITLTPIVE